MTAPRPRPRLAQSALIIHHGHVRPGRIEVTCVGPSLVVEVLADTALTDGHWRHVVRYLRTRTDLGEGRPPAQACQEDQPMPQVPRIRRTEPTAAAVRPLTPLPVVVTLLWHDGATDETDADPVAWTHGEVEIEWTSVWGDTRRDWVKASQVRWRP